MEHRARLHTSVEVEQGMATIEGPVSVPSPRALSQAKAIGL